MATTKRQKLKRDRSGMVDRLFLEHPRSVGMSWAGHGAGAVKVGLQLVGAGLAALVHAVVPGLFGETASRTVVRIHDHIRKLDSKRTRDG
jgi:hypothetical protein